MEQSIILYINLLSTKNARQFRRLKDGRTFLTKRYAVQKFEKQLDKLLEAHKLTWMEMIKDKTYPLKVGFFVYRKTRGRWDWQNIIQGLADGMTRAGYIEDDSAFYFTPVYLGWDIDKEHPRVEIRVL